MICVFHVFVKLLFEFFPPDKYLVTYSLRNDHRKACISSFKMSAIMHDFNRNIRNIPEYQILLNSFSVSRIVTCSDGQTDMTKLIGAIFKFHCE
jgi:hypothetical protein